MNVQSYILLYIDDDPQPIGEYPAPLAFDLDTQKLTDGNHVLKVISRSATGKEGIKLVPFVVRNGPAIAIEGIRKDEVVEGTLPLMINAYGKGDQKSFAIHGSETPQSIPWWVVSVIILFLAWMVYFLITSNAVKLYL